MDPERWKRIEEIYHAVLSVPPERRSAELAIACSADPSLRDELESLLASRENAGSFLSHSMRSEVLAQGLDPVLPSPGQILGAYRIKAEAGAGAMGQVYRALDIRLEREVALKVLPAHFARNLEWVARFRLEAKAASALNHPNIVTIYEIGQAPARSSAREPNDDTLFIATEWIHGVTLRERIAAGNIPPAPAIDIASQCAAALGVAHRAGIIHRDIKPENLMIRSDGLVKVLDFGLAQISKTAEDSPGLTRSGAVMGTPRYMSPEQAKGHRLDARTDIFSLGAVLYEMLHSRPAFPGNSTAEVFEALLNPQPVRVSTSSMDRVLAKALAKNADERYTTIDELRSDLQELALDPNAAIATKVRRRHFRSWRSVAVLFVLVLAVSFAALYAYKKHRRNALPDSDTILLTDFVNQTSDPVFDLTLKQGLAVQLEQSPRLDIFPEERVRASLRLMRRSPDEAVTSQVGREICQREGLKAFVTGIIAQLGRSYVITLEAIGSQTGEPLARVQAEAAGKEKVLHALSVAAADLRQKLGESVRSIRKLDALLENTTGSLEALQAYSIGEATRRKGEFLGAIPFFRRAVELDPDFGFGYAQLAFAYRNTRQPGLAAENAAKAYALRDRTSERERLEVVAQYYELVTGEFEKRLDVCKVYEGIYPRDPLPHQNLAVTYALIGRYDEAVEESRKAISLDPNSTSRFASLVNELVHLNRFDEAQREIERARSLNLQDTSLNRNQYRLAFLNGDQSTMNQNLAGLARRPDGYVAFELQALSAAYLGEWRQSTEYGRRSVEGALKRGATEVAAEYSAQRALADAALDHCKDAKLAAFDAVDIQRNAVSLTRSGLGLAWCGFDADARTLLSELQGRYPQHTLVNGIWLPCIRAALELKRGRAQAAVAALIPAGPYESAAEFWPQYLRGSAYLRLGKSSEARTEFHKIVEHRGQQILSPLYPLAWLEQGHAARLSGDTVEARESYSRFLKEWKSADSDLRALAEAKTAMAGLSVSARPAYGSIIIQ
jgi:serine/threonine protein kinase/Tfp pilus assembly protein PilF